ncbi:MAG: hypothetical protein ACOH5I_00215 [Oligoflexus sp.]
MKLFFQDNQAGGTAVGTALAVASITLMLAYSKLSQVSNDVIITV